MDRKGYLEMAMVVLVVALVFTLVSQPLVENATETNSFLIGGEAEVENPIMLNEGLVGEYAEPSTWNQTVCYWGDINFTATEIICYNETGNNVLTYTPTVSETQLCVYENYVLWTNYDGFDFDIYMKNITTNWTTQLTFTSEDEGNPCMWGDNVIFDRYNSTTGMDVIWLNLNNMEETIIAGSVDDEMIPDIYGNNVVYTVDDGIETWLNLVDLGNSTTFSSPFEITDSCNYAPASIWGDYVVFSGERGGYNLPLLYHIDNAVEYELMPRSDEISGYYPFVWDELVVFTIIEGGNTNIAVMTLETGLFDEHYIQITNDTQDKMLTDFHDNLIVYDGENILEDKYDVYAMEIVEVSSGEIQQEIGEIQTVYNYDWIYFTLIIVVGLIASVVIYYSEYMM